VDEYTALRVLKEFDGNAFPALPIAGVRRTQQYAFRREMPLYLMSIAWPSENKRLSAFLPESLGLFLNTEVETTAHVLAETFIKLQEETYEAIAGKNWLPDDDLGIPRFSEQPLHTHERRILARSFAFYTISLDRQSVESPPPVVGRYWHAILRRARRIVQELAVTDLRWMTIEVFEGILGSTKEKPVPLSTPEHLVAICEFTDYPFNMDDSRGLFADELFALLKGRLNESDAVSIAATPGRHGELIEVLRMPTGGKESDSGKDPWKLGTRSEDVSGILQVVSQIAEMYSKHPDPISLFGNDPGRLHENHGTKVFERIGREARRGFTEYQQVFYAKATRTSGRAVSEIIGCVFVLDTKAGVDAAKHDAVTQKDLGNFAEGQEDAYRDLPSLLSTCELRYLWVSERYRGRNVSRLLLVNALQWCRDQGYKQARVAILPSLENAIERVTEVGFKHNPNPTAFDRAAHPDRLVYEFDLTVPMSGR